ncbi:hypothetical protein ACFE04_017060 [Oxalis oulophora]
MTYTVENCHVSDHTNTILSTVSPATTYYALEAIKTLKAGRVIAVPTDTLYGFACDAWLEIKQAAEGNLEVPGLVEARAYGTEEVWELLKSGNKARSVGSTSANKLSSRSHCSLLRVTIKGENLLNGQKTKSHLWLVDLAGSERVGKIEVEGERLKESQFINKSLSALGDVIAA